MNYEVEMEFKESILICNFPHNREGLMAALDKINQAKNKLIAATVTSSRDGIVAIF
jgi:hypothetical protein